MALNRDQPIMLQPGKRPRYDIPDGTDTNRNFMVGQWQGNGDITFQWNLGGLHFREKKQGESLSDFMERQGLHQLCMPSDSSRHQFESVEYKARMAGAALIHAFLLDKEHVCIGYRGCRCWIWTAVEHGNFRNHRAGSIDVHHLFPAFRILLEDAYVAAYNHKKPLDWLSRKEQHLSFAEMKFDCRLSDFRKLLRSQASEQRRALKSCDSFRFSRVIHNIVIMT